MKFVITKPCQNCPFRRDCLPGWLGRERAREIARSLYENDETFPCHKTTGGDSKKPLHLTTHCAGALILHEKLGQPNWRIRFAQMLGLYKPANLEGQELVFDNEEEFINHHAEENSDA